MRFYDVKTQYNAHRETFTLYGRTTIEIKESDYMKLKNRNEGIIRQHHNRVMLACYSEDDLKLLKSKNIQP